MGRKCIYLEKKEKGGVRERIKEVRNSAGAVAKTQPLVRGKQRKHARNGMGF